uniref:Uncharacterized protein n=1 Tax=Oryza brachyantha TaxID=4533 RepID=J3MCF1_ORYBR
MRGMLPGASTSGNDVGGAIMRRADILASWLEYQELVDQEPGRQTYVKQAKRVRARRAEYKQGELAARINSACSRTRGECASSSSQGRTGQVESSVAHAPKEATTTPSPWPTRRRSSSGAFEVLASMPVGVTVPANSTGDESSTSTHFKRKKARKNVVPGHRPMTRSFRNSDASYSASHNPLYDATTSSENEVVESNPPALQQKEDELAALRTQLANGTGRENEGRASTSQASHQASPSSISLEAIQRMINEGVKAQYMQTHYSMRLGYVKPYPPDVDLVPFPNNYRQPQFSKFNGTGSLHEHVAHFLAACQDTANNGALLLR